MPPQTVQLVCGDTLTVGSPGMFVFAVKFRSQFKPPSAPIYTPGDGACAWAATGSATNAAAASKAFFMSSSPRFQIQDERRRWVTPTTPAIYTPQFVRSKES